jgi:hypothetical protein
MGQDYILDGVILRNCSSLSAILLNLDKQHTKDRLLPSFCFTDQRRPFVIFFATAQAAGWTRPALHDLSPIFSVKKPTFLDGKIMCPPTSFLLRCIRKFEGRSK